MATRARRSRSIRNLRTRAHGRLVFTPMIFMRQVGYEHRIARQKIDVPLGTEAGTECARRSARKFGRLEGRIGMH